MQKKILGLISLIIITLILVSGAAFADADTRAGSISITDIQTTVPQGGNFTFSGTIAGEGIGPYEFQSIIVGDTTALIDSWKLNKENQTTFTATENVSALPVGKYYLILINPVGAYYEVYFKDDGLYYKDVKVDNLDNILGKVGTDRIMEYLEKNDVNDVYTIAEFSIAQNTATSTFSSNNLFGIPSSIYPFVLAACFLLPLLFAFLGRKMRANQQGRMQQKPEVAHRENGNIPQNENQTDQNPASETPQPNQQEPQARQSPGNCPYCGTPIDPELDFCTKCGKKFEK